MNISDWIVCKAHVDKSSSEHAQSLLSCLSPSLLEIFSSLPQSSENLVSKTTLPEDIHFSWFLPIIRASSVSEAKILLSCLPKKTNLSVQKELEIDYPPLPLTKRAKNFFLGALYEKLKDGNTHILPRAYLPKSPFNDLLELSYPQFSELINILGLHDLCLEIQLVIDKQKLKQIEKTLTKDEVLYLKHIAQKKEQISLAKPMLEKWDGETKEMLDLLHKRGLNRLAKALNEQNESLIWHIKRKLDIQEANAFEKLHGSPVNNRILKVLEYQVLEAIAYTKRQKRI